MDKNIDLANLDKCILFRNLEAEDILKSIQSIKCKVVKYKKNETVAVEDDECKSIGILLEGAVDVQRIYFSGKVVNLSSLKVGGIFGEALIFSKANTYPATIIATVDAKILFINKEDVIYLCSSNGKILQNFMELLSGKILMMNKKIKTLSFETIRNKICDFLLTQYKKQKSLTINMTISRKKMAEDMGVQRPSLSRELINMKEEGLIDFDKDTITIKELYELENYIE